MDDREQLARRSIEEYGRPGWQESLRGLVSPDLVYEEAGTGRRIVHEYHDLDVLTLLASIGARPAVAPA